VGFIGWFLTHNKLINNDKKSWLFLFLNIGMIYNQSPVMTINGIMCGITKAQVKVLATIAKKLEVGICGKTITCLNGC
tara:strand:- start:441 stop:674 length:234 start_codon:yes stop_codon:yes gene_type:complete